MLLKWKYIHGKNNAILAAMLRKRSYFVKENFASVTWAGVFIYENSIPVTEISLLKPRSRKPAGPAQPLI